MADKVDLPDADKETNKYSLIGFIITSIYLIIVSILGCTQWDDIINMKPNEWGDFMAGIFGPLALLWVVLGFLQQGVELKNSRKALLLQAEELRNSVEAQKDLGKAAWAQVGEDKEARALEKSRLEKEDRDRKKSNQPIILLELKEGYLQINKIISTLYVENQGNTCFDLEFTSSNSNLIFDVDKISKLDKNKIIKIQYRFPSDYKFNNDFMSISYSDLEGNQYSRGYKITAPDGGAPSIELKGYELTDC